eukprot:scaffold33237_cov33-Tisochrysis_lutea.AAC.2
MPTVCATEPSIASSSTSCPSLAPHHSPSADACLSRAAILLLSPSLLSAGHLLSRISSTFYALSLDLMWSVEHNANFRSDGTEWCGGKNRT